MIRIIVLFAVLKYGLLHFKMNIKGHFLPQRRSFIEQTMNG
ncbi:hypothetical protein PTET_a0208 [Pseudoalteromonas tetraodonis]|nr:hypothetical protein PSM_A0200 [Pseudoalteromonas sp. SM9913]ATD01796.1 hypothetical protein PTET_a0208 [Pseudoalteromonas tetraodonis]